MEDDALVSLDSVCKELGDAVSSVTNAFNNPATARGHVAILSHVLSSSMVFQDSVSLSLQKIAAQLHDFAQDSGPAVSLMDLSCVLFVDELCTGCHTRSAVLQVKNFLHGTQRYALLFWGLGKQAILPATACLDLHVSQFGEGVLHMPYSCKLHFRLRTLERCVMYTTFLCPRWIPVFLNLLRCIINLLSANGGQGVFSLVY